MRTTYLAAFAVVLGSAGSYAQTNQVQSLLTEIGNLQRELKEVGGEVKQAQANLRELGAVKQQIELEQLMLREEQTKYRSEEAQHNSKVADFNARCTRRGLLGEEYRQCRERQAPVVQEESRLKSKLNSINQREKGLEDRRTKMQTDTTVAAFRVTKLSSHASNLVAGETALQNRFKQLNIDDSFLRDLKLREGAARKCPDAKTLEQMSECLQAIFDGLRPR